MKVARRAANWVASKAARRVDPSADLWAAPLDGWMVVSMAGTKDASKAVDWGNCWVELKAVRMDA